ncbi:MAG TPA: T9SS type B sorting domain-containing protein, partial [Clostridia bacterium]|nr:T9SS type B sorting domain-containing protein [Clostridia bacterium]
AYIGGYFNNNSISFGSISLTNSNSLYSDQFLAKYDGSGAVIWAKNAITSTNNDAINSVYSDNNGYIYTTGYFDSPSMKLDTIILNNLGAENIYIAKYNELGNIIWAKSYGGTKTDFGKSVTSDTRGNVYFTGQFTSPKLKFDALNLSNNGLNDLFVTKIILANTIDSIIVNYCPEETSLIMNAPSGYTSYNWTNSIDVIVSTSQTCNITNLTDGSVYFCKATSSSGEIKTSKYIFKKYSTPTITIVGKLSYCPGFQTKLKVSGATKYLWSNGSKSDSILVGTDSNLWVIGYSSTGCKSDTIFKSIRQEPDWTLNVVGNSIFCDGKSITLTASGAATYLWNNGDKTNTITATKAGSYTVIGTNNSGCSQSKTIDVIVSELPSSNFDLSTTTLDKRHNQLTCNVAEQIGIQFNWEMGDGTSETGSNIEHTYSISNSKLEYTITLTATNNYGCSSKTSKIIDVVPFIPNVFTPNGDGVNELFMSNVELEIFDRYGIRLYKGTTGWDGKYKGQLVDSGTYFYLINYSNKTLKGSVTLVK